MGVLDIFAFIFGILGVVLTIKQNVLCWPRSIIGLFTSLFAFYEQRLFGDASLQIIYLIYSIYGWIYWNKQVQTEFNITNSPIKQLFYLGVVTILLFIGIFFLLKFFKGDKILVDAILTSISLTTTYMMIKKWIENWMLWVIIDFAYVFLYFSKSMYLFSVLYFIFAVVAFFGFLEWKKLLKK